MILIEWLLYCLTVNGQEIEQVGYFGCCFLIPRIKQAPIDMSFISKLWNKINVHLNIQNIVFVHTYNHVLTTKSTRFDILEFVLKIKQAGYKF